MAICCLLVITVHVLSLLTYLGRLALPWPQLPKMVNCIKLFTLICFWERESKWMRKVHLALTLTAKCKHLEREDRWTSISRPRAAIAFINRARSHCTALLSIYLPLLDSAWGGLRSSAGWEAKMRRELVSMTSCKLSFYQRLLGW